MDLVGHWQRPHLHRSTREISPFKRDIFYWFGSKGESGAAVRSFAGTKKVENVPPRKWREASLARPCPGRPGWPPGANQMLCEGENRLVKSKDWKSGKSESINEMAPKASSTSVAAKRLAGSEANAGTVRSSRTRLSTAALYFKRFRWCLHMCRDYAGSFPLEEHVPVLQQQNPNFLNPGKTKTEINQRKSWWFRWVGAIRQKRWDGRGQKKPFHAFPFRFLCLPVWMWWCAVPVQPCPLRCLLSPLSLHPHICSSVLLWGLLHVLQGSHMLALIERFSASVAPDFEILCESSLERVVHSVYLFTFVYDDVAYE